MGSITTYMRRVRKTGVCTVRVEGKEELGGKLLGGVVGRGAGKDGLTEGGGIGKEGGGFGLEVMFAFCEVELGCDGGDLGVCR